MRLVLRRWFCNTLEFYVNSRFYRELHLTFSVSPDCISLILDFRRAHHTYAPNNHRQGPPAKSRNKRKATGNAGNQPKKARFQIPKKRLVAPVPLTEAMTEGQRVAAWKRRWNEPPSQVCSVFPTDFFLFCLFRNLDFESISSACPILVSFFPLALANWIQELQQADVVESLRYLRVFRLLFPVLTRIRAKFFATKGKAARCYTCRVSNAVSPGFSYFVLGFNANRRCSSRKERIQVIEVGNNSIN